MAKTQLSYGSQGDEVKELQTALNSSGYSLDVDGVFGSKTQAAVKDYQTKNNLQVDGIVGTNTWASLTGGGSTASTNTTTTPSTEAQKSQGNPAPTFDPFQYEEYKESDAVAQAKAALDAQLAQNPGAYQSGWQQTLKDTLDKIQNREKFSYDLNGDALYQQYKNQYVTQGKQAMMDTMGQAAALTGGYGNSYAQSAGQQTYQGYLQGLNDKIPELYQLARSAYDQETQNLYNQYALYGEQENMDYSRYRDTVSDYNAERDRLQNLYNAERDYDYAKYTDDRNFAYQGYADDIANKQWSAQFDEALRQYNESFAYQQERDKIEDDRWQQEFDLASGKVTGSSFGGSSGGSGGGSSSKGSSSGKGGSTADTTVYKIDVKTENGEKYYYRYNKAGELISKSPAPATAATSFSGSTYSDAYSYIKQNGNASAASGLMTESEWRGRKSSYPEYKNYSEYLKAYVEYALE